MPGPPPKPAELKRKQGNPGKRSMPKAAQVVALPRLEPDIPDSLGPDGAEFWRHIMRVAGNWIGASDLPLLKMAAEGYDRRAFFLRVLADEGWSVMTEKGYPYRHPLVQALSDLEKQLSGWLSALGLTPADRSRLGLAEVKAKSKLEELRERQERRKG